MAVDWMKGLGSNTKAFAMQAAYEQDFQRIATAVRTSDAQIEVFRLPGESMAVAGARTSSMIQSIREHDEMAQHQRDMPPPSAPARTPVGAVIDLSEKNGVWS